MLNESEDLSEEYVLTNAVVFSNENRPAEFTQTRLVFDRETGFACVQNLLPGPVKILLVDDSKPQRVAPVWSGKEREIGVIDVLVRAGERQDMALPWQPQANAAFRLPEDLFNVKAIFARTKKQPDGESTSEEWDAWVPVPRQRMFVLSDLFVRMNVKDVDRLDKSLTHILILARGSWQIRIDGTNEEGEDLSFVTPLLDLEPDTIVVSIDPD